jgi:hypothetical protein
MRALTDSMRRRQFIKAVAALAVTPSATGWSAAKTGVPGGKILETKVISWEPQYCSGWATLIRQKDGRLTLAYNGGRDGHICPFGRVEMMVSHDEGKSWSWPKVILDTAIDDRDGGLVETAKGTLLVTTFSHNMYEGILKAVEAGRKVPFIAEGQVRGDLLLPERVPAWKAAQGRLSPEQRKEQEGEWMIRSTDGGISWSPQYRCTLSSPHGPMVLRDGRLLFVGKETRANPQRVGACESTDDGLTWKWVGEIPSMEGHNHTGYHELHSVEAADGTIVAHIRNHNAKAKYETLQTESKDHGRTWSVPHEIGVWGFPSHLLKLTDDRLLMTYSHRRLPYGNNARVSSDHGRTWSEPILLSPDSDTADLGYPSTAQLSDGSLLSVWYEALNGSPKTVLRQARWTLQADA